MTAVAKRQAELPGSLAANPALDTWIRIDSRETITLFTGKVEYGQGLRTAIARIGAEELDVSIDRIRVQNGRSNSGPREMMTVGSLSMMQSGMAMRTVAAEARAHLLELAAGALDHGAGELTVDDGTVLAPDGTHVTYWDLLGGRPFGVQATGRAEPKQPDEYRILGEPGELIDIEAIVTGTHTYVADLADSQTLFGRVVRPPAYGCELESIDTTQAQRIPGVVKVVRSGTFLGVVARREEVAVEATDVLARAARWTPAPGVPPRRTLHQDLQQRVVESWQVVGGAGIDGPIPPIVTPSGASQTVTARFTRPHVMHAALGPSAAKALWRDGRLTVWSHSQAIHFLAGILSELLDLDPADVETIHVPGPGCYGHNGADDAAFDAALLAREVDQPVLLQWSRADEHKWEPYGPAMVIETTASLDADGKMLDFNVDVWSPPQSGRPSPLPRAGRAGPYERPPARMIAAWHMEPPRRRDRQHPPVAAQVGLLANIDPIYELPAKRLALHSVSTPMRTSTLRSIGNLPTAYAVESFVDELALAAGADPLQFRLRHLGDPRMRDVLLAAAERADWSHEERPFGEGRGIGMARYGNAKSYAAVIVDVLVDDATAEIGLQRAVIAADAGQIVDPDGLRSQLEGGLIQSVGAALMEEVAWEGGEITSVDWDTYPVVRFSRVPLEIEVVLIDRPGMPFLGAGEAAGGPAVAALANAVRDAIGVRLSDLPFTPERVRDALL